MGGEAPAGTKLVASEPNRAETVRRLALVQLAVGVPALLFVVFGVVLGYRLSGRPLGDIVFWGMLAPVLGGFFCYFARAFLRLRGANRAGASDSAPAHGEPGE